MTLRLHFVKALSTLIFFQNALQKNTPPVTAIQMDPGILIIVLVSYNYILTQFDSY